MSTMPPTPEDHSLKKSELDLNEATDHAIILDSSSDEEAITAEDQGYSLLPQEPDHAEYVHIANGIVDHVDHVDHAHEGGDTDTGAESAVDDVVRAIIDQDADEALGGAGSSLFDETPTPEARAVAQVWNQPASHERLEMDQEHMKKVTEAMSKIKLPPSSYPTWATQMTDEQLKAELTNRLTKSNPT